MAGQPLLISLSSGLLRKSLLAEHRLLCGRGSFGLVVSLSPSGWRKALRQARCLLPVPETGPILFSDGYCWCWGDMRTYCAARVGAGVARDAEARSMLITDPALGLYEGRP